MNTDNVGGGSHIPRSNSPIRSLLWLISLVRSLCPLMGCGEVDLGTSTRYNDAVIDIIVERLPVSTYYGIMTLIITYIVCVPLGIMKAIKHNTTFDNVTSILTLLVTQFLHIS